jgi:hypothetical protein
MGMLRQLRPAKRVCGVFWHSCNDQQSGEAWFGLQQFSLQLRPASTCLRSTVGHLSPEMPLPAQPVTPLPFCG